MKQSKSQKRDKYLQDKYGITLVQYTAQLEKQLECCALCGKHKSEFSYSLHQDHNHKSKRNRGIVCYFCNKFRIGRHDLASAEALYAYMVEFEG